MPPISAHRPSILLLLLFAYGGWGRHLGRLLLLRHYALTGPTYIDFFALRGEHLGPRKAHSLWHWPVTSKARGDRSPPRGHRCLLLLGGAGVLLLLGSSGFFWVLLVFFWRSSGVLLVFFWVLLVFFCVIERQKNTRRTPEEHQKKRQKNTRRTQKNPEGEEHQPPPVCISYLCCLRGE